MYKLLLKNNFSYVEVLLDSGVNLAEVVKQIQDTEASNHRYITNYKRAKQFTQCVVSTSTEYSAEART